MITFTLGYELAAFCAYPTQTLEFGCSPSQHHDVLEGSLTLAHLKTLTSSHASELQHANTCTPASAPFCNHLLTMYQDYSINPQSAITEHKDVWDVKKRNREQMTVLTAQFL